MVRFGGTIAPDIVEGFFFLTKEKELSLEA